MFVDFDRIRVKFNNQLTNLFSYTAMILVVFATEITFCDNLFPMKTEKEKQRNRKRKLEKKRKEKKERKKKVLPAPKVDPRLAGFQIPALNQRTTLVKKFP